jgi:hypothetical protein
LNKIEVQTRNGVFGVSSGAGLLSSSSYRCRLTIGGSAAASMQSTHFNVKLGIGAVTTAR